MTEKMRPKSNGQRKKLSGRAIKKNEPAEPDFNRHEPEMPGLTLAEEGHWVKFAADVAGGLSSIGLEVTIHYRYGLRCRRPTHPATTQAQKSRGLAPAFFIRLNEAQ